MCEVQVVGKVLDEQVMDMQMTPKLDNKMCLFAVIAVRSGKN